MSDGEYVKLLEATPEEMDPSPEEVTVESVVRRFVFFAEGERSKNRRINFAEVLSRWAKARKSTPVRMDPTASPDDPADEYGITEYFRGLLETAWNKEVVGKR